MSFGDSSEASKLLEAALLQMDGIIQGTKIGHSGPSGIDSSFGSSSVGQPSSEPFPITDNSSGSMLTVPSSGNSNQAKNRESSLSAYENGSLGRGGKFGSGGCGGGWSHISEALANLHEAIVRSRAPGSTQGGSPELNMRDAEVAQSVGFWLEQSGLLNRGGNETSILNHQEKESMKLQISLLHQQLEEKNQQILDMEGLIQKHQQQQHPSAVNPSEVSQLKSEVERLQRENAELRNLCSGGRVPRYLPLSSPHMKHQQQPQTNPHLTSRKHGAASTSPSDNDASPTLESKGSTTSAGVPPKAAKGFKKIFHKIKRSNSGGHLGGGGQQEVVMPAAPSPSPRSTTVASMETHAHPQQHFVRNGLRATTAGRLGSSSPHPHHQQLASTRRPFNKWTLDMIGIWLDSLGLGAYVNELAHAGVQSGETLAGLSSSDLESKLGMKKSLHRKKLVLAISSKQELANAQAQAGQDGQPTVVDAAGKLDHYWVTRWLDDVGLPQYKEAFLDAKVDGRVLNVLTVEDLISELSVTNLLHHYSIKHGIFVLRKHKFDPSYLKRRAGASGPASAPDDVGLWTNHRVMEWLKEVDLAEYAPNLRGSGVHGSLMVNERKFNDELLADLLAIPANKTLLRRHLSIHFKTLVGTDVIQEKRTAEQDSGVAPLTPSTKAKTSKLNRSGSTFTLSRKKSKTHFDYDDLICPFVSANQQAMVGR